MGPGAFTTVKTVNTAKHLKTENVSLCPKSAKKCAKLSSTKTALSGGSHTVQESDMCESVPMRFRVNWTNALCNRKHIGVTHSELQKQS